ncbi:hypothetical protein D3C80_1370330 [compost metagenome]
MSEIVIQVFLTKQEKKACLKEQLQSQQHQIIYRIFNEEAAQKKSEIPMNDQIRKPTDQCNECNTPEDRSGRFTSAIGFLFRTRCYDFPVVTYQ